MVGSNNVLPLTRKLHYKNEEITLTQLETGDWVDDLGTVYPKVLIEDLNNFCGVENITTGKHDPFYLDACFAHDSAFKRMLLGRLLPNESNLTVMADFAKETGIIFLKSLYGVVMAPAYLIFGGLGGALRWEYLNRKRRK